MSRAPSTWMAFNDDVNGDVLRQEILVPSPGTTPDTYYCTLDWNPGWEGGGYCGLQAHSRGKSFIYSIWDPRHVTGIPIKPAHKGQWTETSNFGGEGTGLKSMDYGFGWKSDEWYTLVTRAWEMNSHTMFGFWIHNQTANQWNHMVTMDYPVSGVRFTSRTRCFLEDWAGTGNHQRDGYYRNGFKRRIDGIWYPFTVGDFSVNVEASSHTHANNFDAGATNEHFFMSSGGKVHPSPGVGTHAHLNLPGQHADQPPDPPIKFNITKAHQDLLEWHVPESSTPQFRYIVKVNDHQVADVSSTEDRSHVLHGVKIGDNVSLEIEDILARKTSLSTKISS